MERSEDEIFGTPSEPENEAEEDAEQDWLASNDEPDAPDTASADEMEDMSEDEAQDYYDAGGEEP